MFRSDEDDHCADIELCELFVSNLFANLLVLAGVFLFFALLPPREAIVAAFLICSAKYFVFSFWVAQLNTANNLRRGRKIGLSAMHLSLANPAGSGRFASFPAAWEEANDHYRKAREMQSKHEPGVYADMVEPILRGAVGQFLRLSFGLVAVLAAGTAGIHWSADVTAALFQLIEAIPRSGDGWSAFPRVD